MHGDDDRTVKRPLLELMVTDEPERLDPAYDAFMRDLREGTLHLVDDPTWVPWPDRDEPQHATGGDR